MYKELSVGQFTSTGPLTCWTMIPIFRGVGLGKQNARIIYLNII
jgi:hypothetical protein